LTNVFFGFLFVLFILFVVPLGALGFKFGMPSMYTSFLQVVSLYGYFKIEGGSIWHSSFNILSISTANIQVGRPECAGVPSDFYTVWRLQMSLPYIAAVITLLYYFTIKFLNNWKPYVCTLQPE